MTFFLDCLCNKRDYLLNFFLQLYKASKQRPGCCEVAVIKTFRVHLVLLPILLVSLSLARLTLSAAESSSGSPLLAVEILDNMEIERVSK